MTDKPENPYAFPVSTIDGFTSDGMTLRDWFAGQALAGLTVNRGLPSAMAGNAYDYADAMLAERSKGGEQND